MKMLICTLVISYGSTFKKKKNPASVFLFPLTSQFTPLSLSMVYGLVG